MACRQLGLPWEFAEPLPPADAAEAYGAADPGVGVAAAGVNCTGEEAALSQCPRMEGTLPTSCDSHTQVGEAGRRSRAILVHNWYARMQHLPLYLLLRVPVLRFPVWITGRWRPLPGTAAAAQPRSSSFPAPLANGTAYPSAFP